MTSRLTSEAFMPSVPMVMPSLMAMVLNSFGVPPASRMPCMTFWARWRRLRLHGMVSIHVLATPMIGFLDVLIGEAGGLKVRARRARAPARR